MMISLGEIINRYSLQQKTSKILEQIGQCKYHTLQVLIYILPKDE